MLLLLIFLRAPIGLAMFSCGMAGLWLATGSTDMVLAKLKSESFSTFSSYSLSIIPMFLLMGQFATLSGMSPALFKAAEAGSATARAAWRWRRSGPARGSGRSADHRWRPRPP